MASLEQRLKGSVKYNYHHVCRVNMFKRMRLLLQPDWRDVVIQALDTPFRQALIFPTTLDQSTVESMLISLVYTYDGQAETEADEQSLQADLRPMLYGCWWALTEREELRKVIVGILEKEEQARVAQALAAEEREKANGTTDQ